MFFVFNNHVPLKYFAFLLFKSKPNTNFHQKFFLIASIKQNDNIN